METSQSTTSTTASTVASLTSEELPIGPYQFEVIGKFRSDNGSNGIGMTLSQINGSSNQFIGSVSAQLTSTTQSETSFVSPGTLVVSNSVPNANTDYAVLMK